MPRSLKSGILGAGTIILFRDIHNYILCMVRIFMNQTLFNVFKNNSKKDENKYLRKRDLF